MGTRPSLSAVKLARGVALTAQFSEFAPLLPPGAADETEELLTAAGLLKPWMIRLFRRPSYQRFVQFVIRHTNPGQLVHVALRKRFMDEMCTAAIERGARQLLSIGAGLDPLGYRMAARHPEVLCVDVDTEGTMSAKRNAVAELEWERDNLAFVGADLAVTDLGDVLARVPSWRRDAPTVIVAEGLVMYLARPAVERLLAALRANVGPGSELLMSYLVADRQGKPRLGDGGRLVRAIVRLAGSPFRWGAKPGELKKILRAQDFALQPDASGGDLQSRYLAQTRLAHLRYPEFEFMARAVATAG